MSASEETLDPPTSPPEGGQDPAFVKGAFAKIADRYVLTNHVLSCGVDILWRKKVGAMVREWDPKQILDVASGTGDLALELQKCCPGAELLATDFCPEMLSHASKRGVHKTEVEDAMSFSFEDDRFDLITVAFGLRNMANWQAAVTEMKRVLKPGGHLLVLDFSLPQGVLRKPYTFYLNRVLPKVAGVLTGQRQAYEYLACSIDRFPSGEGMLEMWRECGFADPKWHSLSGGIAAIYTAEK